MTKLRIEGMTCHHCVMHVKKALLAVPGAAADVDVSLEKKLAIVNGPADVAALVAAVEEEGYTATPLP